jgi:hypothetical protein
MTSEVSEAEVALRLSRRRSTAELVVEAERHLDRREAYINHTTGERPLDENQRAELIAAKSRADTVNRALSRGTLVPRANEPAYPYRVRLAADLKHHHPQWRNVDLAAVARSNPGAFAVAEGEIYDAATARGLDPEYAADAPEGTFRERVVVEPDGMRVSYFHGSIHDMIGTFNGNGRSLAVKSFGPRFRLK